MAYSSSVDFISANITYSQTWTSQVKGQKELLALESFLSRRPVFLWGLTLPKLPFPSKARKLKSLSRTRSMLPDGRLNRR